MYCLARTANEPRLAKALTIPAQSFAIALVRASIKLAPFPEKSRIAEAATEATNSFIITIISALDLLFTCPPREARITVAPAILANAVAIAVVRTRYHLLAALTSKTWLARTKKNRFCCIKLTTTVAGAEFRTARR